MSDATPPATGPSFKRAATALKFASWRLQSYLLPSHVWTYWNIVRTHNGQSPAGEGRFAWFDFTRPEIDNSGSRYVFALVRDFEALGFRICYRNNYRFLASMREWRFKRQLLDRPFLVRSSPADLPENTVAVEVSDRPEFPTHPTRRQIRVRYDESLPRAGNEIAMTFSVHPSLYDESTEYPAPDLEQERPWRVFFAGRILKRKYETGELPNKFGKMSRPQMLETLEASLPPERLRRIDGPADLEPGAVKHPGFVWAGHSDFQIPREDWFNVLSRSDFFLACPGMEMPLCHNLIEAMARGAVPILEHPEFLDPPLEHGLNCLVFHGRNELIQTVEHAFQMTPEQLRPLRRCAYDYYQKNLLPGRFAERLLSLPHRRVDLLLNAYRTPRQPAAGRNAHE